MRQALATLPAEQAEEILHYIGEHHQHMNPSTYIMSTVSRGFRGKGGKDIAAHVYQGEKGKGSGTA